MLVKMGEIPIKARKEGYGVVAVSCFSSELIEAAILAAKKKCSPIVLNINPRYDFVREEQNMELFLYVARQRAMRSAIPVAINLGHDQNYQTVMRAINHGFTSVTVDTLPRPYEENVAVTKRVVRAAHGIGFPVEAELGCIGMTDETFVLENKYTRSAKTDPTMMKDFVEKTGVDFLAISIGDAHGSHTKNITPHIDLDPLGGITAVTPISPVLHGSSGTGDENLSKACKMGISRTSVGTDLMETAIWKASQCYRKNPDMGRTGFLTNHASGYQEGVEYHMDVLGSTGETIPSVTLKTKCSHSES